MVRDCDYIRTKDNIIFIVHGDFHTKNAIRCTPVYIPDVNGDRINRISGIKYIKKIDEYPTRYSAVAYLHPEYLSSKNEIKNTYLVPVEDVVEYYSPRKITKELLKGKLKGSKWEELINNIVEIAQIPIKSIGIYGSHLVHLDSDFSDVDILIYGEKNLLNLKKTFDEILKKSGIQKASYEQRVKRVSSWSKYSAISQAILLKMELNRWSRINVYEDVITSIRFVYDDNEIPNIKISKSKCTEVVMKGKVIDSIGSHFCPRIIKVKIDNEVLNVISHGFLFFSCVKDGDEVEIFGNMKKESNNKVIVLENPGHYIFSDK